jgi:hypothetical protein
MKSPQVDIQKNSDAVRKMEPGRAPWRLKWKWSCHVKKTMHFLMDLHEHFVALGIFYAISTSVLSICGFVSSCITISAAEEKQRNMDEQNWKAQMDAVHDVLDTKVRRVAWMVSHRKNGWKMVDYAYVFV